MTFEGPVFLDSELRFLGSREDYAIVFGFPFPFGGVCTVKVRFGNLEALSLVSLSILGGCLYCCKGQVYKIRGVKMTFIGYSED